MGAGRTREPAEQCRAAAQLDPQVHHDAFAFGVDGGVGDLGECLTQVVGDRPVEAAAAGRRRVVAHAPQRLVAFERHRLDVEPCAFGIEAGEVAQDVVGRWRRGSADHRCDPVLVHRAGGVVDRERAERPGLRLGVLEDRPSAGFDQQQLARTEATTPDGLGSGERHGAGLGRDRHEPVIRHREGRRPEPVPIDQRPDPLAVREDDRGGPIPRREEAGRAAAQRGDVRVRGATEPECLGDRRQQGGGQGPAGRGQELERLVERERIGAVGGQERAGGEEGPGDLGGRGVRRSVRGPARGCHGPC